MNNVIMSSSPDTAASIMASRDVGNSMLSGGIVANEWIPIIRAVLTSIIIGLLPFLALFIPTPMSGKALGMFLGFFVWLAAWGITDVIVHQFAMDYSFLVFEEVRQYQLGLVAISSFGTSSLKTLAAFGIIRWSGLGLATVLTTMLVKFGNYAVSAMSGQLMAAPRAAGSAAGQLATPEGASAALNKFEGAIPQMSNAYRFDFMERTGAKTAEGAGQIMGMSGLINTFGSSATAGLLASDKVGGIIHGAAYGAVAKKLGLENALEIKKQGASLGFARTAADAAVVKEEYGGDPNKLARMETAQTRAIANAFERDPNKLETHHQIGFEKDIGDRKGIMAAFNTARENGFQGDFKDYNKFISEMQSTRGFQEVGSQEEAANKYFSGDKSKMFGAISAIQSTEAAAKAHKFETMGINPLAVADATGKLKAVEQTGQADGYNRTKDANIRGAAATRVMDPAAKYKQQRAQASALGFKGEKGFMKFLEVGHGGGSIVADSKTAPLFEKAFRDAGLKNLSVKPGDNVSFRLNPDTDKISGGLVTSGGQRQRHDHTSSTIGRESRNTNKDTFERGTRYEGAYQATLEGDFSIFRTVADRGLDLNSDKGRAEVFALATSLVQDQNNLYQETGISAGSANASGEIKTPKFFGATGSIDVRRGSTQNDTTNLSMSSMIQVIEEGRAIIDKSPNLSDQERQFVMMNRVRETLSKNYEKGANARQDQFGADTPVGMVKDILKSLDNGRSMARADEQVSARVSKNLEN